MCKSRLKWTKITTNKSLGFASFSHWKSIKPIVSLALYWKLYVPWTVLESTNKIQLNIWYIMISTIERYSVQDFNSLLIFVFIFNANYYYLLLFICMHVIVCNIIRFQRRVYDGVSFRLVLAKEEDSILTLVCIETIFVLNSLEKN